MQKVDMACFVDDEKNDGRFEMNAAAGPGTGLDLLLLFGDVGMPTEEKVSIVGGDLNFSAMLSATECCGSPVHGSDDAQPPPLTEEQIASVDIEQLQRERLANFAPPGWTPLQNSEQLLSAADKKPDVSSAAQAGADETSVEPRLLATLFQPRTSGQEVKALTAVDNLRTDTSPLNQTVDQAPCLQHDEAARKTAIEPLRLGERLAASITASIRSLSAKPAKSNLVQLIDREQFETPLRDRQIVSHPVLFAADSSELTTLNDRIDAPGDTTDTYRSHTVGTDLQEELSHELRQVPSVTDVVVIELEIPELGGLEIEVSRDARDTEVSLHADPALHLLLRNHLQELVAALSESGIELSGLDVRQQGQQRQNSSESEVISFEVHGTNDAPGTHPSRPSVTTGLARYRLMSVTA